MHALTHGTNGLLLGYALVFMPMLAALIRARAPVSTWFKSFLMTVPIMVIAGIVLALIGLVLGPLGVGSDGVLSLIITVAVSAGLGYVSGRALADRSDSNSAYRRGAVVSEARLKSDRKRSRRAGGEERGAADHFSPLTWRACRWPRKMRPNISSSSGPRGRGRAPPSARC